MEHYPPYDLNYSSSAYGSQLTMVDNVGDPPLSLNVAGGQSDTGSSDMNKRSMSHTLLSQFSSTSGFRSPSPSTGFYRSHGLSRTPSLQRGNISGFHRGPSLQSLVKSFINRVSRGTQTDSNDDYDNVSIASMQTGFSEYANDLTRSRLKLFLNDQLQYHTPDTRSYANSNVDEQEFVEELKKIRDDINGRLNNELGVDSGQKFRGSQDSFVFEDDLDEAVSIRLMPKPQTSRCPSPDRRTPGSSAFSAAAAVATNKFKPETATSFTQYELETCDRSVSTDPPPRIAERASQTALPVFTHCASQTDIVVVEDKPEPLPLQPPPEPEVRIEERIVKEIEIREVYLESPKPVMASVETQTDILDECSNPLNELESSLTQISLQSSPFSQSSLQQQQPLPPPPPSQPQCLRCLERDLEIKVEKTTVNHVVHHQIPSTHCEFVISHADIIYNAAGENHTGNGILKEKAVSAARSAPILDSQPHQITTPPIEEEIQEVIVATKRNGHQQTSIPTSPVEHPAPQNGQTNALESSIQELPETKTIQKMKKKKIFQRILAGEKTRPRIIVVNGAEMAPNPDDEDADDKIKHQCCTIS